MSFAHNFPRVDATVSVIPDDVACATPQDHCNCAVAQAIKRAVGRPDAAAVISTYATDGKMPADRLTFERSRTGGTVRPQAIWRGIASG